MVSLGASHPRSTAFRLRQALANTSSKLPCVRGSREAEVVLGSGRATRLGLTAGAQARAAAALCAPQHALSRFAHKQQAALCAKRLSVHEIDAAPVLRDWRVPKSMARFRH